MVYGDVISTARQALLRPTTGPTTMTLVRCKIYPRVAGLYHVGLLAELDSQQPSIAVLEHGPHSLHGAPDYEETEWDRVLQLPGVALTPDELLRYQNQLPKWYLLGVRDCRHHIVDILRFAYELE